MTVRRSYRETQNWNANIDRRDYINLLTTTHEALRRDHRGVSSDHSPSTHADRKGPDRMWHVRIKRTGGRCYPLRARAAFDRTRQYCILRGGVAPRRVRIDNRVEAGRYWAHCSDARMANALRQFTMASDCRKRWQQLNGRRRGLTDCSWSPHGRSLRLFQLRRRRFNAPLHDEWWRTFYFIMEQTRYLLKHSLLKLNTFALYWQHFLLF